MNLLETYKKRLALSENVYSETHQGAKISDQKKLAIARLLDNTNKYMTEAFSNSVGTQRSDLGEWKRFCLNLINVAVPTLIAPELVIVHPMSSISGYVTYVEYCAGSNKGQTKQGDVFNSAFGLGTVDKDYTSEAVVENIPVSDTSVRPAWTPVVDNKVTLIKSTGEEEEKELVDGKVDVTAGTYVKVKYRYNNVVIPQNDIPTLNARIKSIPLVAKARRISIYYSQIAAFQAKTDYGMDLGAQLADKAVGQLQYEIDTEIVDFLSGMAQDDGDLVFNKAIPVGISKAEHYEGFSELIEIGAQKIYEATKRFSPNYLVISPSVKPILTFIKGFTAAPRGKMNGPYYAGDLNGLKVFVSPSIASGRFFIGVNGDDLMSSAAVYAPYMPIIPTQLLGFADGGMSQGFSTMYALEKLNPGLLIAGKVIDEPAALKITASEGAPVYTKVAA